MVGDTLTATPGTYTPADVEVAFTWLANGRAITGATSPTLVLRPEHVGARLSVRVTASAPGYAALDTDSPQTAGVRARTIAARLWAATTRSGTDVLTVRTGQPLAARAYVTFYRKYGRRTYRVKTGRLGSTGALRVSVRDPRKRTRSTYYARVSAYSGTAADTSNTASVR
jgi:hypothetical protein